MNPETRWWLADSALNCSLGCRPLSVFNKLQANRLHPSVLEQHLPSLNNTNKARIYCKPIYSIQYHSAPERMTHLLHFLFQSLARSSDFSDVTRPVQVLFLQPSGPSPKELESFLQRAQHGLQASVCAALEWTLCPTLPHLFSALTRLQTHPTIKDLIILGCDSLFFIDTLRELNQSIGLMHENEEQGILASEGCAWMHLTRRSHPQFHHCLRYWRAYAFPAQGQLEILLKTLSQCIDEICIQTTWPQSSISALWFYTPCSEFMQLVWRLYQARWQGPPPSFINLSTSMGHPGQTLFPLCLTLV